MSNIESELYGPEETITQNSTTGPLQPGQPYRMSQRIAGLYRNADAFISAAKTLQRNQASTPQDRIDLGLEAERYGIRQSSLLLWHEIKKHRDDGNTWAQIAVLTGQTDDVIKYHRKNIYNRGFMPRKAPTTP